MHQPSKRLHQTILLASALSTVMVLIAVFALPSVAAWQSATLASVGPPPLGLAGSNDSQNPAASDDGRYVVFHSKAGNFNVALAPAGGVFRKDLRTGALSLVVAGTNACGVQLRLSTSANGRFIAFDTQLPLVANDTNGMRDVYVRDMEIPLQVTAGDPNPFELVSARDGGLVAATYAPGTCAAGSLLFENGRAISDDGSKVIFTNRSVTNLPAASSTDTQPHQVFIRDRGAQSTRLVTQRVDDPATGANEAGLPLPEQGSEERVPKAAISGDGSAVVWAGVHAREQTLFHPSEDGGVGADNDFYYMWRRVSEGAAATTRRVTGIVDLDDASCDLNDPNIDLNPDAAASPCLGPLQLPEYQSYCDGGIPQQPSISDSGDKIAYLACSEVRNASNGLQVTNLDAYATSMVTGISRKVGNRELTRSDDLLGNSPTGAALTSVALSGDGSLMAFVTQRTSFSSLTNPAPVGAFPSSTFTNAYVIDHLDSATTADDTLELLSRGVGGADLLGAVDKIVGISDSGARVGYTTASSNVVAGDANGKKDVFVVEKIGGAPDTYVDSGPSGVTNVANPSFTFSSNKLNPTFACRVDTAAYAPCTASFTAASLSEGPHTFDVRATAAAQTDATPASRSFTVDLGLPPAPTISAPSNADSVATATPAVSGSETDNTSTVDVYDGATLVCSSAVVATAWSCTTSSLADGLHTLTAKAHNTAGTGAASAATTIAVDTHAPAVGITSPTGTTGDSTPSVVFTIDDLATTSGIATKVCSVDSGSPFACESGSELPPQDDGAHSLTVSVTDNAGNTGVASSNFTVLDTTAPAVPVIESPIDGLVTGDDTPTVSGLEAEDGATVDVYSGATLVCSSVVVGGAWSCTSAALGDGPRTLTAKARDEVPNTSVASTAVTITVDTTPPPVPVITSPSSGTSINTRTPNVSGTSSENGATIDVLDGTTPVCTTTVAAGVWSCNTTSLTTGSHTLKAKASDEIPNISAASTGVTVIVDVTAPAPPAISAPVNGAKFASNTPTVSGTGSENGSTVRVFSGATEICTSLVTLGTWSCVTSALADGTHSITAKARDLATNLSAASVAVSIGVDTNAPTVTVSAPTGTTGNSTPTVVFSVDDLASSSGIASTTCRIDAGTTSSCASGSDLGGSANGAHTVTVTAIDNAGNVGIGTSNFTVADVTAPAVPSISSPANGGFVATHTPIISGSESENGVTVDLYDAASLVCSAVVSAGSWSCTTSSLSDGTHSLTAKARDSVPNTSAASAAVTVGVDTQLPSVSITAPSGTATSATPAVAFTFADPVFSSGIASKQCKIDSASPVNCSSGDLLQSMANGSHSLTVTVTDGAGNASASSTTFTVNVPAPPAPAPAPAPSPGVGIFSFDKFIAAKAGKGTLSFQAPEAGSLTVVGSFKAKGSKAKPIKVVLANKSANTAGANTLALALNATGKKALKKAKGKLAVTLQITFKSASGLAPKSLSKQVIFKK